ncbi:MAG TPA: RusA family crossover junction endodeoxyribonuclease [Longimicrobium sp.]|nr:RusA family crossover junction endodeoxyribonuclease [Longimicrobium sp.]
MESYEFVVPGRPVSVRSKKRVARRNWIELVKSEANRVAPAIPFVEPGLRLVIIFLWGATTLIDVDNVIKPIQDALSDVMYLDDAIITDVEAYRRTWTDPSHPEGLPLLLRQPWLDHEEYVYVRVEQRETDEETQ